jgi:hypothetical protein
MTTPDRPLLFLVVSCALLLSSVAKPVGADDAGATKAHLRAAAQSVTSGVIDLEMTIPFPIAVTMTYVGGRTKAVTAANGMRMETYTVDGVLYMHTVPGDSWRKMAFDPQFPTAQTLDVLRSAKDASISVLPDRQEDGVPVGVIQLEVPLPTPAGTAAVGPPAQLTCSYDKTTFHLRACANAQMSMTFSRYNDPSNAVVLPPEAANAVLIKTHPSDSAPGAGPAPDTPAPIATPNAAEPSAPASPLPTTPAPAPSASPVSLSP